MMAPRNQHINHLLNIIFLPLDYRIMLSPVAVEGTSDDLDQPVAELFVDPVFKKENRLGSLNSVNIVRLLVQVGNSRKRSSSSNSCSGSISSSSSSSNS